MRSADAMRSASLRPTLRQSFTSEMDFDTFVCLLQTVWHIEGQEQR